MLDESLRNLIALHGVGETRSRGILIVDDEPQNLIVLRNFLEGGYRVFEAQSGKQALEVAKSAELDVVITDQRMPEMSGVELLEKLREFKPDVAGIVLTGFTDPPALISAINRARVFRFLKKPWAPAASVLASTTRLESTLAAGASSRAARSRPPSVRAGAAGSRSMGSAR